MKIFANYYFTISMWLKIIISNSGYFETISFLCCIAQRFFSTKTVILSFRQLYVTNSYPDGEEK
jgi:hypothetical protein